jgi:aspartate 1-decarboxylase
MLRIICKSKIHRAKITEANLHYEGSITIDEKLLKAADILVGEKVEVLNLNNGSRIETYAIQGKSGSGEICLNGPAARFGCVGDEVIILAYCMVDDKEAVSLKAKIIYVDERNRIKD